MKINFDLYYCNKGKSPIGKIQLDNDKASILYPEPEREDGHELEDFEEYSYEKLPHLRYENYMDEDKNYKKRKFNYRFSFSGELEVEFNEFDKPIGTSYSRTKSGCTYLNLYQEFKLKYFYNKLWWQRNSSLKWVVEILFAPILVSIITTLVTLHLSK